MPEDPKDRRPGTLAGNDPAQTGGLGSAATRSTTPGSTGAMGGAGGTTGAFGESRPDERYTASRTGSGTDELRGTAERAAGEMRDTAEEVRENAQHAIREGTRQAASFAARQKEAAAEEVGTLAGALRRTAEHLESEEHGGVARYAGQAAEYLDRVSRDLRERDLGTLLSQTEDFARRQPGVFFGGAVAAGFLLARFLSSSSRRGASDYRTTSGYRGSSGYRGGPGYGSGRGHEPSGSYGGQDRGDTRHSENVRRSPVSTAAGSNLDTPETDLLGQGTRENL